MRRSRLDAVKSLKAAQQREAEFSAERAEVRQALAMTDQEVTTRVGQIKIAQGRLNRLRDEQQPLLSATMRAQEDEDRLKTKLARLGSQLAAVRSDVRSLEQECAMWAREAEEDFQASEGLSEEEEAEMQRLSAEADRRKDALVKFSKEVAKVCLVSLLRRDGLADDILGFDSPSQLERAKDLLEMEIKENLSRRRDDLRARLAALDVPGAQEDQAAAGVEDLEGRKRELKKIDRQIKQLNERLDGKLCPHIRDGSFVC